MVKLIKVTFTDYQWRAVRKLLGARERQIRLYDQNYTEVAQELKVIQNAITAMEKDLGS